MREKIWVVLQGEINVWGGLVFISLFRHFSQPLEGLSFLEVS